MNLEEIKKLLPHREPFLFVDTVTKLEENRIEAYRDIRPDEFYFKGHFPGYPVLPGVLMVEAIAQTGTLLVLSKQGNRENKKTLFAGIDKVRFRHQVRPGERLLLSATLLGAKTGIYKLQGWAHVGEELACEAIVMGALRD
ncbi:hypothetical protein CH330_04630 [candidate division WOR-3 bacterium JGI_Cruoil_03_51_56]|uniref:3-hydroxyacyl-[acyl-carrier-protein] dehydratase n=1 Tax=candidate division WOR-3 bacterium JGI_Cruoil_03_51_56 TaxID=1973747 RepID=A0A235BTZ8_UNCW3|nr:MAG: hypothetical protein CH330_04630 [candidate division WOR-3 bacterium JGI_Cruoil_03_51_56]